MAVTNANLIEKVPVNIVKGASLETIMNNLFNGFEAWEQRNAELVNRFFNQSYFRWEESLIDKLVEVRPDIKFDDIKNEWINLALLTSSDWLWEFNDCLNKITNDEIKKAFIQEIFDKVQSEIWTWAPYTDFATECSIPWNNDVVTYFHKVVDYLNWKEGASHWKKSIDVLRKISISNDNLNTRLSTDQIPSWVELTNPGVPANTKDDFDKLLSFEIGKEADRTVEISKEISRKLEWLFSNTFPAINTIISENDKFKYDESKLWSEYQWKAEAINNNTDLDENEKGKQLNDLKRKYYLKYVKSKNAKIGNALEQLYNNNFDYSKLEDDALKNYIDTVVDTRLKMLFDNWINEVIKLNWWNLDEFKVFCKDLADPTKTSIDLSDVNLITGGTWTINIPVQKHKVEWENPRLKDIDQFLGREKSYDALPIRYEINKSDIDGLDLTIEDKTKLLNFLSRFNKWDKYVIEWKDVWMLIYLFFVINSRSPLTTFKSDDQEKIQNLFWEAKNREKDWEWEDWEKNNSENNSENNGENNSQNNSEDSEWIEGFTPEKFKEEIERKWPWKFENWSEVWLPMWDSELPGWWYQWMKVKINNINMKKWTFKWKIFWWELKFSSKYEWKTKEFKMDKSFFDGLEGLVSNTTAGRDKIWLLPNPDKSDFNTFRNKLNGRLWTADFSFPPAWTTWDGSKFMHKITDKNWKEKEVEVKHFWVSSDDKLTYKVEYNPIKRSFTVSSEFNWDEKWKDWKSEKKRFSYKRDMDWNNFLIFFTQKWLVPQTEKQAKDAIKKQNDEFKMVNWWKWKLNWFSFNNIKNVFKTIKWNIKKKIDDYNKAQDEKLEDILIWDWWLYGKLAWILWFIPSMKSSLWELEQEYYNERDNRTWKKIEPFYKQFCADYDLPDTFDQEPPYIKIKWKWSLKDQVLARVRNAKDRMWDPWIYQAAWLLLANIEKWWSPYRWLVWHENEWLWVKALLGNAHYEQFLRDKQKCIDAFWTEENKDKLQDALANSEMTYIINNIYWKDWWLLFWSHESRWIPGKDGTNYIENPSKKILSEQFAKKLEDLTKDNFTKDSVINKMPKHNYFDKCEKDFYRLIKSARFSGAMSELEWMISLARTDTQVYTTKKCYLILMLSGILDFNWNKGLRKLAYMQWKTFGFAPAMLAKNIWHSEEIALLLDDFSGWDFSKNVTAYFHKKDLLKWETNITTLISQVNDRFTEEKMKEFDEYVESIPWKNREGKSPALIKLKKDLTDYDNQNPDDIVLKNAKMINSAWLNASADAVSTRLRIENWEFKWKDQDEKKDIADFWTSCAKKIDNAKENLGWQWSEWAKHANQMLEKYLWRFWINWDNKQVVYKRINTAYRYNDRINESWKTDSKWSYCQIIHKNEPTTNKEWKPIKIDVPLWRIYDIDIKKVLRYWLEWFVRNRRLSSQQLPQELKKALDAFQEFFEKAFDKGYFRDISNKINSDEDKIFHLWWWDVYEIIAQKDSSNYVSDDDTDTVDSSNFKDLETKKQKALLRKIFNSDSYKNTEMNNMRKSLRNHWITLPDKQRGLFNDRSGKLEELQQYL